MSSTFTRRVQRFEWLVVTLGLAMALSAYSQTGTRDAGHGAGNAAVLVGNATAVDGGKVDAGAASSARASSPDASVTKPPGQMTTWCGYFVLSGVRRTHCSPLPLKEAQAECDKIVTELYKMPSECSCSDDKVFIGDRCSGPDADKPQDDTRLLGE